MDEQVKNYLDKYPGEITEMFYALRQLIYENAPRQPEETLWAKLPSYYLDDAFIRLIPFKDHINIEAQAISRCSDELTGYKITPRGMLQIYIKQTIPAEVLGRIFAQTLGE